MDRTTKNTLAVPPDGQQERARCEAQGFKPVSENGQAKGAEGEPAWERLIPPLAGPVGARALLLDGALKGRNIIAQGNALGSNRIESFKP